MEKVFRHIFQLIGGQTLAKTPDILISSIGCCVGISAIAIVSWVYGGKEGLVIVAPSMGAAAVLVYAFPHAPMSQPWPLFMGNIIGAIVGVCCQLWVTNIVLASGLAVGIAMAIMHLCRCVHPPGGASALAVVIGGEQLRDLGFDYVLFPVLLNCCILFITAVIVNAIFPWRRYPLAFRQYHPLEVIDNRGLTLTKYDFINVIREKNHVTEYNINQAYELYSLAEEIRRKNIVGNFDFEPGGVYGNNEPGALWEIRKIVDYERSSKSDDGLIIYKILEGPRKNHIDSCRLSEFALWSRAKFAAKKGFMS